MAPLQRVCVCVCIHVNVDVSSRVSVYMYTPMCSHVCMCHMFECTLHAWCFHSILYILVRSYMYVRMSHVKCVCVCAYMNVDRCVFTCASVYCMHGVCTCVCVYTCKKRCVRALNVHVVHAAEQASSAYQDRGEW